MDYIRSKKFVCIRMCDSVISKENNISYKFLPGEKYTYFTSDETICNYIYRNGSEYRGKVKQEFVDQNFVLESDWDVSIIEVDELFDKFLLNG